MDIQEKKIPTLHINKSLKKTSGLKFTQKEGLDYNEIFSPIVKYTFMRVALAIVENFDLELDQMDNKIAFLRDSLEETAYMH